MSDEKHVSVSTNLALADATNSARTLDPSGPFQLSGPNGVVAGREFTGGEPTNEHRSGAFGSRRGRNGRSRPTGESAPQSPTSDTQLTEEHYLSAALAEEGSRPSLAFVFPPLARAIEDAAKEARSPSSRLKKPTGRGHLHIVESLEPGERGRAGRNDPFEIEPPDRSYDCRNYDTCLGLAAALNWNSFACTGCPGTVNEHLLWRAHSEVRKNKALAELCDLPDIQSDLEEGVEEIEVAPPASIPE